MFKTLINFEQNVLLEYSLIIRHMLKKNFEFKIFKINY